MKIDIAIGKSRKDTHWRNKSMLWADLAAQLSTTHRTHETVAQYLKMSKDEQDRVKDIGGFVGGMLAGGRRKAGAVLYRTLVTLDADFADADLWDKFTLFYGCAAVVYSTHKHKPDSPRLRLVIPLDREVDREEFAAISRRIAYTLGIDQFDHTCHQPERLMYWPSTSKDGEYYYQVQEGEALSADEVLGAYVDWRDTCEWPVSSKEREVLRAGIKKQGDPHEKPGVVGAMCRAYGMEHFLLTVMPEEYTPAERHEGGDVRFSYTGGSTAGGLVLYDDKFAYSHHGTDPVSGRLVNVFDLLRYHRFIHLDEDRHNLLPINKRPSYDATIEWAMKQPEVRQLLASERRDAALSDFETEIAGEGDSVSSGDSDGVTADASDEVDTSWMAKLDVDKAGKIRPTTENLRLILEHDPLLRGRLVFNQLSQREELVGGKLPWRRVTADTNTWDDKDDSGLRGYIERLYGISSAAKLFDALNIVLLGRQYHPVKDYLAECERVWDGERGRVDRLLIDYMGAEDSDYVRAVTRKALCAAVARVMRPGIKFDYVLTLVGPEGIGKSTLIQRLGGKWFSDAFSGVAGREAYEQLQGVWIMEMGEMAGLKKAEVEQIKLFVSRQEDKLRMAFGRRVSVFKRQSIFMATTNRDEPLRESNGNRRWWIVSVPGGAIRNVWEELNSEEVMQVWGEVMAMYKAGERLVLGEGLEEQAREIQGQYTQKDERVGMVVKYLNTPVPTDWGRKSLYERRAYLASVDCGDVVIEGWEWLAGEDGGGLVCGGSDGLRGDGLVPEGFVLRDKVSALEVYCDVMAGKAENFTRLVSSDMANLLHSAGWKKSKNANYRTVLFGTQRAYERNTNQ